MNDQCSNFQKEKVYDLEERTARFGESLVGTLRKLPKDCINDRLIKQAVGSGGSLGANYCEANEAESTRDFIHKISICKKEAKEAVHWLRLLIKANPEFKEELMKLKQEAYELLLIFSKILRTAKENQEKEKIEKKKKIEN